MPDIPLATTYWLDAVNRTDTIRLVNMIVGEDKISPDGMTRRQRPGLSERGEIGNGPINFMWQQEGTLDGDVITISDGVAFRDTTSLGVVGDSGIQIAGGADRAVIVASGAAWRTDGTSLVKIVMPDDVPGYEGIPAPVGSVRYINGFFLLSVLGSQRFYFIQPGADDPDPLDFASAERTPDPIVGIAISGDEVWFLGGSGEEVWTPVPDADAPFQRINGRVYQNGCASVSSIAERDTAIFWVTGDHRVVMAAGAPQEISDDAIASILETDSEFTAWIYKLGSHSTYVLTTETLTLAFDLKSAKWSRFHSYNRDTWRAAHGCQIGPVVIAGDSESAMTWTLDYRVHNDAGQPLVREVSGAVLLAGAREGCASVSLATSVGWSPTYGFEPTLELRWSDDQGVTWSTPRPKSLGDKGQYTKDVVWRSLGMIQRPGRNFVFRMTDDALWRADYAKLNEA